MLPETENMGFVTEPGIEKRYIKTGLYKHKSVKKRGNKRYTFTSSFTLYCIKNVSYEEKCFSYFILINIRRVSLLF